MKKVNKKSFCVWLDPYRMDLIVFVGVSFKEAAAYAKKIVVKKNRTIFVDWLKKYEDCFDEVVKKERLGYTIFNYEHLWPILILQEYREDWEYWETVIHETNHVVYFISEDRNLVNEREAQAYLQEHLFHTIRRKLQGVNN